MRIRVICLDTRGGVQPYGALALGLHRAGHDVAVVAPATSTPLLESAGVRVLPVPSASPQELRDSGAVEMGRLARLRLMRRHAADSIPATTAAVAAACEGADLLTGGIGGAVVGLPVAEALGVPFVQAHLQPLGPPTAAFPGVLVPQVPDRLGGTGRRASHRASGAALSASFAPSRRLARASLGLPRRPLPAAADREGLPVLYGYSPRVVPHPPEWGPERHVTGYWTLPEAPGWRPPSELEAFMGAGEPPVCIGFGSMTGADPAPLSALVLEAVRRAGVRAVLLSGWGALEEVAREQRDDVLVLDEVPHEWLFPRTAAAVHHGGAGTTGAALRAGVPSVVVPFAADQPFWASRVVALGAGTAPLPRRRLTAPALAAALRRVTTDVALRERTAALGSALRAEDGVGRAVEVYGALLR